ncbi:MAG: hypothetical protein A2169_12085 [Deltaproteobacteria bacterium RBG_13_47_9]|nr:MAG: hypothetical protein A2169_12085 [Deltaproteobacteria bacterium RBG_13_47_9]
MEKVKFKSLIFITPLIFFLLMACGPKRRIVYEKTASPPEKAGVKEEGVLPEERVEKRETRFVQHGIASWYGGEFHGRATSSGEIYDMYQLTCAHNNLPLGSMVIVTNLENGRSLELKVNDRGPFVKGRIIDLSYSAARLLGIWEKGTALVRVESVDPVTLEIPRFSVQVGSFTDEFLAKKLAEGLQRNFERVYVSAIETSTQKYHRVRVGVFGTREAALEVAEKLSQMGFNVLVTSR